jgi:pyruvate formate lyase activating enzyme
MSGNASLNRNSTELRVGGLARLSSCDWPGKLAATIFCQGCAWDCAYCHNPGLRPMQAETQIAWPEVLAFLESRLGLLDGVVFSGGEPTLQPALLDAIKTVRNLGFRIGLHTAGMVPARLERLLPCIDWVGFDVKAPFGVYSRITGVNESGTNAIVSLQMLLASGISYEVRTTFHPTLLSLFDMLELRDQLLALSVTRYVVQRFHSAGTRASCLPLLPEQQELGLPPDYGNNFLHFLVR